MPKSPTLTDFERRVLGYVATEILQWGVQPTYRDIAQFCGYSSPGFITVVMDRLEQKGVIERIGSRAILFDWKFYCCHPLTPQEFLTDDLATTHGCSSRRASNRRVRRVARRGSRRSHRVSC